ncbi:hypothetical protein EX895_001181 [Sporisorium graminicola]|uniref:Uncharacterized protein n=1 Tax=Sporisorium graminicola TaxID=280036 RepID=A0A4U7KYD2_9BASI|nr:hypothetical protein EX895_001181 [Sporisorium graminicola]TKY89884.1 hypothetical protein EX895_001181 [Sporisorium graminicola]
MRVGISVLGGALAVLVSMAVLATADSTDLPKKTKYVRPPFRPLPGVEEDAVLPDAQYPSFDPRYNRPRDAIGQGLELPNYDRKPWWQRWKLPWTTGAQVGPDDGMKTVQPSGVAVSASTEAGAKSPGAIVKNSANQKSWLPQWNLRWRTATAPTSISSIDQLRSALRSGVSRPAPTGDTPHVPILQVGRSHTGVKLPGNGWDARIVNAMSQRDGAFLVSGANGKMWLVDRNRKPIEVVEPSDLAMFSKAMEGSGKDAGQLQKLDLAASQGVAKTASRGSFWSGIAESARGAVGALGGARSSLVQYFHGG